MGVPQQRGDGAPHRAHHLNVDEHQAVGLGRGGGVRQPRPPEELQAGSCGAVDLLPPVAAGPRGTIAVSTGLAEAPAGAPSSTDVPVPRSRLPAASTHASDRRRRFGQSRSPSYTRTSSPARRALAAVPAAHLEAVQGRAQRERAAERSGAAQRPLTASVTSWSNMRGDTGERSEAGSYLALLPLPFLPAQSRRSPPQNRYPEGSRSR